MASPNKAWPLRFNVPAFCGKPMVLSKSVGIFFVSTPMLATTSKCWALKIISPANTNGPCKLWALMLVLNGPITTGSAAGLSMVICASATSMLSKLNANWPEVGLGVLAALAVAVAASGVVGVKV